MKFRIVIGAVIGALLVYLCAAFILWEPNPHEWGAVVRGMFVWCSVGACAIGGMLGAIE